MRKPIECIRCGHTLAEHRENGYGPCEACDCPQWYGEEVFQVLVQCHQEFVARNRELYNEMRRFFS